MLTVFGPGSGSGADCGAAGVAASGTLFAVRRSAVTTGAAGAAGGAVASVADLIGATALDGSIVVVRGGVVGTTLVGASAVPEPRSSTWPP